MHRVVATGLGIISPLGNSVESFWDGIKSGRSGVGPVTRFPVDDYSTRIAAEVKDFDPTTVMEKKEARKMDLAQQYAIAAAQQAFDDAGLPGADIDPDRAGVIIGSGIGGLGTFEEQHQRLLKSGPGRVSPFFIPMMIIDMSPGLVSMRFGWRGPNYSTVSACASSGHAIIDAYRIIQRGEADIVIAGGSEATITPTSLAGFCSNRAMSTRNDEPERASRPYDKDRDGFVMGEGSAIVVLESIEHATARGARIYGEVKGAGMTADAYHITAPHPEGIGAKRAMINAMNDADLEPTDIDYINTHGTSTGLGDIAETKAIKAVLGDHAHSVPCNSTKSMIGHLLGSAGAIEVASVLLQMHHKTLHPTINLDDPDPECDLDYVPNRARSGTITNALSNSFGFGGHNTSILVGSVNGAH